MSKAQMQTVDEFKLEAPDETPLAVPKATPAVEAIQENLQKNHKPGTIVKLNEKQVAQVEEEVSTFMSVLKNADAGSEEILSIQEFVRNLGNEEMNKDIVSSKMLNKSLGQLDKTTEGATVSSSLLDLRNLVEELDPSSINNFKSKFLRKIPFVGDKLDNKIKKFQSSQEQINVIVESLNLGKQSLAQDNLDILEERKKLWNKMGMLEQFILATQTISNDIKSVLPAIAAENPEKARIIQQDILFYVEQKHMDLLTNLAVNMQGYMSLDVAAKNNTELIKGVDRATNTTVQALKVSVMLAQLLANQKNVAEKVKAVHEITESLVLGTAKALNQQGVEISKAAMSASLKPEVLQEAFTLVVSALDNIDNYKIEAISSMQKTISNLDGTVQNMKKHLDVHREKEVRNLNDVIQSKREQQDKGGISLNPLKPKI